MIRINLLPVREARRRASLRQQGAFLGFALAAGAVMSLGLHLTLQARISSTRNRIEAAHAELTALKKTLGEVEEFRKKKDDIERKLSVIADLERSRVGPVRVLDELATRIPERVWLTTLSLRGGVLDLEGYGIDNEVIAAFMTTLGQSSQLRNVELLQTDLETKKGLKLNRFKIRARETRSVQLAQAEAAEGKGKKGRRGRRGRRQR